MEGRGREREFPPSLPPHQASDMEPWFGAPQGPSVWAQGSESCCITALSLVWPNLVEYSQSLQRGAIPPAPPRSLLRRVGRLSIKAAAGGIFATLRRREREEETEFLSLWAGERAGTLFPLSSSPVLENRPKLCASPLSPSHSSGCRFVEGENGESLSAQSFITLLEWYGMRLRMPILILWRPFFTWSKLWGLASRVRGRVRKNKRPARPTHRPTATVVDDRRCVSRTIDFSPFL